MMTVNTIAIPTTSLGPTLIPLLSSESKYLISPAEEEKPSPLSFAMLSPFFVLYKNVS